MHHRRFAGALAAAAAVAAAGCGSDELGAVDRYIQDANAISARAAPQLERANGVYRAFSAGKLDDARARADVARIERALLRTRADLAELEPPDPARLLHVRLVRVFELNASFAGETTMLAQYVPDAAKVLAPLDPITRRLQRRLRGADAPQAQAEALTAYRRSVNRQLTRLRRLDPPPVLAEADQQQKERLLAAGQLAERIERAVLDRDAQRVARLVLRFRRLSGGAAGGLTGEAIAAYQRRYRKITRAAIRLERERSRLERELG